MIGEYDPNGDRMFNGDTLKCSGWLVYQKAGRAGLVFQEGGAGASADDSWRDQDYEDEQAYFAYQQSLNRSEEHTSELQSLMRISYAVFCLNKQTTEKIKKNEK